MKTPNLPTTYKLVLTALLIAGCASAPAPRSSLPGTTTANPQLERDTIALVLGMDKVADCTCNDRKVVGRQVVGTEIARTSELWTIDRCGTILEYVVNYSNSPIGGTMIGFDPFPKIIKQGPDRTKEALPKMFEDVWYRAGDRRFPIPAYSASGKLIISEQRISFGEGDNVIVIDVSAIRSVCWGMMASDTFNEWVIVRYGSPEKMAGFKDGSRLGWGTSTPLIMAALLSTSSRKATP